MRDLQKAVVAAVIAFTSRGAADPMPTSNRNPMQLSLDMECPEVMRGMKLEARAANGGVTLHITNPRAHYVTRLRRDLRSLAELVEYQSNLAESGPAIPPLRIAIANIPSGVRVSITPEQSHDVVLVRQLAMILQTAWEDSECSRPPTVM
jgi:hypothetical protein